MLGSYLEWENPIRMYLIASLTLHLGRSWREERQLSFYMYLPWFCKTVTYRHAFPLDNHARAGGCADLSDLATPLSRATMNNNSSFTLDIQLVSHALQILSSCFRGFLSLLDTSLALYPITHIILLRLLLASQSKS